MPRGDFLVELTGGAGTKLQFFHFVGSGNERLCQRNHIRMCPGELPVLDAVESCHPAGMTVHHPEKYGLVLFTSFSNRLGKIWTPGDICPEFFWRTGQDRVANVAVASLGQLC